ncbi:MAG: hypothetical protein AAF329_16605 [Cyanobacteria bacterium P01_A01_bin.17]
MFKQETMTITHFEHLGELIVRPRTNRDVMITIPAVTDRRLTWNMTPSLQSRYNASLLAVMEVAVVEPAGIVDIILDSLNPQDLRTEVTAEDGTTRTINVFQTFSDEYEEWIAFQIDEASGKKSGTEMTESGTESVS